MPTAIQRRPASTTRPATQTSSSGQKKPATTTGTGAATWKPASAKAPTPAQVNAALTKAFPKFNVDVAYEGVWALSLKSDSMNTPYMLEQRGTKLALISSDYTDTRASLTLKPGQDLVQAMKTLMQRAEAGAFDGVKAPPKGWPSVAQIDQLVVDALPKFTLEPAATPNSYIGGLKSNPGYEVMIHVRDGEVRISRLDDRSGRDQSVRVPLKVGDDFKKVIASAMKKLEAKKNDPVPQR